MPRPQDNRIVHEPPLFTEFKPIGVMARDLEQIMLSLDEFEAIRLADYNGLSHAEAADEMEISRSTFSRLIEKARKKVSDFFINGKLLNIEGGNVHFRNNIIKCQKCGYMFRISIGQEITECPVCHSDNLLNHAGGFGHGKCCGYGKNNKRR
ncbi:MAG: DUF134 domain-containing protein [Saprospiraceae bacterium]|nr:DUF134 domain-containing protein [Saprospiraceae bacterium]